MSVLCKIWSEIRISHSLRRKWFIKSSIFKNRLSKKKDSSACGRMINYFGGRCTSPFWFAYAHTTPQFLHSFTQYTVLWREKGTPKPDFGTLSSHLHPDLIRRLISFFHFVWEECARDKKGVCARIREPIHISRGHACLSFIPFFCRDTEYHVKMRDLVGHLLWTRWDSWVSHRKKCIPHYLQSVPLSVESSNVTLCLHEMSHQITKSQYFCFSKKKD